MAYSSTISQQTKQGETIIKIVEREAATASETTGFRVPARGRIIHFRQELISGSGAGTNPELGREAGWTDSSLGQVCADLTTAGDPFHDDATEVPYSAPGGMMYLRSQVDAGSDNVIETEIHILEGW